VLHLPLRRWRTPILILLLALGLLMSVLPLLSLLATALTRAYGLPLMVETATLAHFTRVLTAPQTLRALLNSLWLSGAAAVLLAALALPFAVVEAWSPAAWLRRLLRAFDPIIEAPYALPGVVLGIAIILLLIRPLPLLNISLYGTATLILIAYLARFLPLILRPVQASLRQIDPVLDEAGQAQGAGFLKRFRRITLPLLLPSAVAGGVLVFLTAFSELTVSSLLWSRGNETVGIIIYFLEEGGDAPGAAAMSMICLAVIFTLAGLCTRLPLGVRRLLPWGV
jgi:iron(III) transport system permease protein